uniref:G_PROTEIN_RECEP_F1_2 domain-containing protein n=1 Tax=Steinernema glaseri TaxID=37863 RepID=A0A1I7Z5F2_9BILA
MFLFVISLCELLASFLTSLCVMVIIVLYLRTGRKNLCKAISLPLLALFLSTFVLALNFFVGCIELFLVFLNIMENSSSTSLLLFLNPIMAHVFGTWCDFASVGLFVQRTIMVLKPFHSPRVHAVVTGSIVISSLFASVSILYVNVSTYKPVDIPLGESCYAFYCLASLGIAERTLTFYLRLFATLVVVISGTIFVISYMRTRQVSSQAAEDRFASFVRYTFIVRTVLLIYFIPDIILSKTIGKNLSDFTGPSLMLFVSINSLLTVVVYYVVVLRRQNKATTVTVWGSTNI